MTQIAPPTFDARSWCMDGPKAPFVAIERRADGAMQVSGESTGFVGHRMNVAGEAPRGAWGEWNWDGETLNARVDPLGGFQLFVYASEDRVIVSPSLLQVLAQGADPQLDAVANAVFHRVGFYVGNDTGFAKIKVLPPNGTLRWSANGWDVSGAHLEVRDQDWTKERAIEALIDVPRHALGRFLGAWDGGISLPISGGRDSRHTLLEMGHLGRLPDETLTYHHTGAQLNAEAKSARALAEYMGVHHKMLGHPRKRVRDSMRGLLLTQLCADEIGQMMPLHDYLAGSANAVIDGVDGDFLGAPHDEDENYFQLSQSGAYDRLARDMIEGHGFVISQSGHQGGAGAVYSPDLEEAAAERLAQAMAEFSHMPDPFQAFWFYHRTRRELSYVSTTVMGGAAMVFSPYLDPDVLNIGLSLPFHVIKGERLNEEAMARINPDAARVPYRTDLHDDRVPRLKRFTAFDKLLDNRRMRARLGQILPALAQGSDPRLQRGLGELYGLHDAMLGQMSSELAQSLMQLDEELAATAPRGDAVVSQFVPD